MLNYQPEFFNGVLGVKSILYYLFITVSAIFCSYFVYPTIIYLSYLKRLAQPPNARSSHTKKTPVLGGVGIFIGFIISGAIGLFLLHPHLNLLVLIAVFFGCFILFGVGITDDILPIRAMKKLITQILVATFIVLVTKNEIASLQGLFGIYELPKLVAIIFTVFVYIIIINGFNLIDGIDGLAGLQTIVLTGLFGSYFAMNNRFTLTLLACCLFGAMLTFLYFNFSKRRKIFMGDSGTLFVGFLIAYFAVASLNIASQVKHYELKNSAVLVMSILSYPLIDTLRVFAIRIYHKRSPFSPDRNHLHHVLIDMGIKHSHASIYITIYTVLITALALSLNYLGINVHFIIMVAIVVACLVVLLKIKSVKNNRVALDKTN